MDQQRRILKDGAVVVEGNRIAEIGEMRSLQQRYPDAELLGGSEYAVLPGLINTHTHLASSLYRGIGDDMSLMEMNKRMLFPIERAITPEDVYVGALLSLIEMVRNGITTTADMYLNQDKVAEAIRDIGMRGVVSTALIDQWEGEEAAPIKCTDEVLEEGVHLVEQWNGAVNGRIRAWFAPYTELLASEELMQRVRELADRYRTGIHVHLAETLEGVERIRRRQGTRVFEYVNGIGLLGSDVLAAHCCWLSEKDIAIVKQTGVKIAHMPSAEMKLSDGITPVPRLLSEGICVAVGLDGPGWNNCNDLLREAKTAALLHKVNWPLDPELIPAEVAFEMITVNAARALCWDDEIGSLEVGKRADILLVDLQQPYFIPLVDRPKCNIINQLIYAASGHDVDTVLVDGEIVVQNHRVVTVDENQVLREGSQRAKDLIARSGVGDDTIPLRWTGISSSG
jgi:5-methylthioadenosine/S-adenosylhomocysteine deaminase